MSSFRRAPQNYSSITEALSAVERFCAYQERCESEIKQFFRETAVPRDWWDDLLKVLAGDDFYNDNRFCEQFAGGKFRVKSWGRIKIRAALREKGLPSQYIEQAIDTVISQEDYSQTLLHLIDKYRLLHGEDVEVSKLIRYLQSKGFELDVIMQAVHKKA